MYNDIGGKIKKLTKTIAVIEAFITVIIASSFMFTDDEKMVGIGVLVMIIGCVIAWISSWLLYGFGEIIEKVSLIEENTRNKDTKTETYTNL